VQVNPAHRKAAFQYEIPNQLANQYALKVEKLWDIVQAQKWEKAKQREQYLNHIFQTIEEQKETIERDFDEQVENFLSGTPFDRKN
jgi:hypothetical protein